MCRATTPSLMRMAQEFCLAWVSDLLQGGLVDEMDDGATTGSEVPRTVEIDDVASMTVDGSR